VRFAYTIAAAPRHLPPPQAPPATVREAAKQIMSRPEFQQPARSLYQRFLDWVLRRVGDAIDVLAGNASGTIVAWLLLVLALAAVGFLVFRGLQSGRPLANGEAVGVNVERRRPPADWDADALRLEAAGDWRGALRCRYRALVARLARAGLIEEIPGRTAGEYQALVNAALPERAPVFTDATDLFERAWYGGEATGPEEGATFRGLAERVLEGAGV